MSYEILLSDTAREELQALAGDTPERTRVQALLDRIAQSSEHDHVLSAAESAFELRYCSLQTTYIFFRREETAREATVIYFCEMNVEPASLPGPPPTIRMLDWQTRDVPHGMEHESTMEVTRPDGSQTRLRHFVRKIDMGDSYTTFFHHVRDHHPAHVMIVTGKKGEVKGDFRHDELKSIWFRADGAVTRFPLETVPVWIKNPFEGLTPEQMMERMREHLQSPEARTRFEAVRQKMSDVGFAQNLEKWRNLG